MPQPTELYNLKGGARFRVSPGQHIIVPVGAVEPLTTDILTLQNIDGMYANCSGENFYFYPAAWTIVEEIK